MVYLGLALLVEADAFTLLAVPRINVATGRGKGCPALAPNQFPACSPRVVESGILSRGMAADDSSGADKAPSRRDVLRTKMRPSSPPAEADAGIMSAYEMMKVRS